MILKADLTHRADGSEIKFKRPTLTPFEKFVWENSHRTEHIIACETNRTEQAVSAAYSRAHRKMREIEAQNNL